MDNQSKTPIPITPEMLKTLPRVTTDIECLHDVDKKHFKFSDTEYLKIAVACCLNHEGDYKDFIGDESAFRYFGYLNKHKMIVGYNVISFDFPLIGGSLLYPQNPYATRFVGQSLGGRIVDLALDFHEALGQKISLAKVSVPTLGDSKEMKGELAPEMFRNGKILEVLTYCRGDTRRADELFVKAVMGEDLKVETPQGIKTFKCTPKLRWAF